MISPPIWKRSWTKSRAAHRIGRQLLREFWKDFSAAVGETKELKIRQVIDTLDDVLGPHIFPAGEDGVDPRKCPTCDDGRLNLKLGRFGAFIGCTNYPECRFTRPLSTGADGAPGEEASDGPKDLGLDPDSSLPITLRKGPYGHYVQLGDATEDKKAKPKRVSLFKGLEPASVTHEIALKLLALPRLIGKHPETAEEISAGIGRFGPYLKYGAIYKSIGREDDVLEIGMNRAVELLASAKAKTPARSLGDHPADGKPINLSAGRYGPYVSHGGINANLPKGRDEVSFEEAVALLAAKAEKSGKAPAKGKKPAAKKAAAPKAEAAEKKAPAAKKPAAKKAAPKKTAAKKPAAKE